MLQEQAKALGDATRYRIFRYLCEAANPVGVAELTDYLGLNHNAVRQHLAALQGAGLVIRDRETRRRPGRPRLLYRPIPEAGSDVVDDRPYEYLASLLGEVLSDGDDPLHTGRTAGRREAAKFGGGTGSVEALEEQMARSGFRPSRRTEGAHTEFVLGRCPFEAIAAIHPETVCRLHLGLAEGLAAGFGDLQVAGLIARDPHGGGCRLSVRSCSDTSPP